MAYGYARASGKPTVCLTTSGPGTINLITGIALAYKGRAPVIVLAGDVPRELIDRDGNQAFDLVNLFKPITYMAQHVQTTERVQEAVHNAFRTALSGKRGPVMLNIPRDLLDFKTIDYQARQPASYRATDGRVQGDREAIARAAALLANAERPLLIGGGGVIDSDAAGDAVKLAEHLDMALIPSYGHSDSLPNSHPLFIGMPGWRGSPEAHEAIHHADDQRTVGQHLEIADDRLGVVAEAGNGARQCVDRDVVGVVQRPRVPCAPGAGALFGGVVGGGIVVRARVAVLQIGRAHV